MMDDDRTLSPARGSTCATAVTVPFEHLFPQTAEVFLILPFERVAGGAHAQGENLPSAATAVQRSLNACSDLLHFPLPFPLRKSISLPCTTPGRTGSANPRSSSRAKGAAKPPDFALL